MTETFAWWADLRTTKVEWSSASTRPGALSVMTSGEMLTLMWSAVSSATTTLGLLLSTWPSLDRGLAPS